MDLLFFYIVYITCKVFGSRNLGGSYIPGRMDSHIDETRHVILLGKFEKNKRYKEQIIQEIIAVICAMLNCNGGTVVTDIETAKNDNPVGDTPFSQMSLVIRILEQSLTSIIGIKQTVSNINFQENVESIVICVKKSDSLITTNYNLYLPSQTQVVQISPLELNEKVKDGIINRKSVVEPVEIGSHCQTFCKGTICDIRESKTVQLKHLEAHATKRTTLADRITGKGNKLTCYVSAFANHIGGHIYFGITCDRVVVGEVIPNEEDKREITKKVEKTIKKMIWPEYIGQPKRGEHWEIFFVLVLDEGNKPIPSTFVIVIYIAPCLGGVFTEAPDCYEMLDGKVKKMSVASWKKKILLQGGERELCSREQVPRSISPITWSSARARKSFTESDEVLIRLINNGEWDTILKKFETLQERGKLLILSKQITACCRRGQFKKARDYLKEYDKILPKTEDRPIFEVMRLYLEAALKRASGDFNALKELLIAALSMAEFIEPGLVPAIVYLFAATVVDLIYSDYPEMISSPAFLSRRALQHLHRVPDSSDSLLAMKQKAHITLATFHLGCNINGQHIKKDVDSSDLKEAATSIAVCKRADHTRPLTKYHEAQLELVLSSYNYRRSQVIPDEKVCYLREAFKHAEECEHLAKSLEFIEMVEWSQTHKAFCTEELLRAKFKDTACTSPGDSRIITSPSANIAVEYNTEDHQYQTDPKTSKEQQE